MPRGLIPSKSFYRAFIFYFWRENIKLQLSIEFILLLAVSTIVLGITVYSFQAVGESASLLGERASFLRESQFFYELVKELCITGDGNSREVFFSYGFDVSSQGEVTLNLSQNEMRFELGCEIEEKLVKGRVLLYNERGKIKIENLD